MPGIRLSNTHKGMRIKNTSKITPNSKNSDSLVIIQWSCDPPPEYEVDTLIDTRHQIDNTGITNANKFFKSLYKRKESLLNYTRELNKDFTTVREGSKTAQKMYEISKTDKTKTNKTKITVSNRKIKNNFSSKEFKNALFNGNIIFIPIHGGNILDEDGDVVNQVVLPDKTYLVSFNPPNTNMLFLDRNLAISFLNIIVNKTLMEGILYNSKIRGRVFERELVNNFRVWGPGNTVINRGLQLDRDVDILFKPFNETQFKITRGLSKAALRMEANKTIYDLYPKIIQQMHLTKKRTAGRVTRKNMKPKQLFNKFKKLKKTLLSNKKFKITLKQKSLL